MSTKFFNFRVFDLIIEISRGAVWRYASNACSTRAELRDFLGVTAQEEIWLARWYGDPWFEGNPIYDSAREWSAHEDLASIIARPKVGPSDLDGHFQQLSKAEIRSSPRYPKLDDPVGSEPYTQLINERREYGLETNEQRERAAREREKKKAKRQYRGADRTPSAEGDLDLDEHEF